MNGSYFKRLLAVTGDSLLHKFSILFTCSLHICRLRFKRRKALHLTVVGWMSGAIFGKLEFNQPKKISMKPHSFARHSMPAATRGASFPDPESECQIEERDELQPLKLRGCRISQPLLQIWGERCRVIEWINPAGEHSLLVVPGNATVDQIRHSMRAHENGAQHILSKESDSPVRQVLLRI